MNLVKNRPSFRIFPTRSLTITIINTIPKLNVKSERVILYITDAEMQSNSLVRAWQFIPSAKNFIKNSHSRSRYIARYTAMIKEKYMIVYMILRKETLPMSLNAVSAISLQQNCKQQQALLTTIWFIIYNYSI